MARFTVRAAGRTSTVRGGDFIRGLLGTFYTYDPTSATVDPAASAPDPAAFSSDPVGATTDPSVFTKVKQTDTAHWN